MKRNIIILLMCLFLTGCYDTSVQFTRDVLSFCKEAKLTSAQCLDKFNEEERKFRLKQ